jgi:DNA-3-methyladenine glycosylase I
MTGSLMPVRCSWCEGSDIYRQYHDTEWGVPLTNKPALFRMLMLEGQQAGLSWITILNKRAHMDSQFWGFDPEQLAKASAAHIEGWLTDPGLIRHRGKLAALVNNAQITTTVDDFAGWLWSFAAKPTCKKPTQVPAQMPQSQNMSKALKKAGFRFVGPTICYAFMQSAGMVNDHHPSCWRFEHCETLVNEALNAR